METEVYKLLMVLGKHTRKFIAEIKIIFALVGKLIFFPALQLPAIRKRKEGRKDRQREKKRERKREKKGERKGEKRGERKRETFRKRGRVCERIGRYNWAPFR